MATTVYLTTYTTRHGTGTRVFSTAEARDKYSNALGRKIWANRTDDEPPEDNADFWTAFYERFQDHDIEDDHAEMDAKTPVELANEDAG